MLPPMYYMPPVSQEQSSKTYYLQRNSPPLQGEAGKELRKREIESQQRFIGQKQDGATVTLNRLVAVLLDQEEMEDDYLSPTFDAFLTADTLLREASVKMKRNFPQGSVSADGSGGVRIQWQLPDREVRLAVSARPGARTYIYHEQGAEYATEKEVTSTNLAFWLDHLVEK